MPPSSDSPDPSPGFFRRFWPWMVWGVFGLIVLTTVGIVSLRLYLRSQIEQEYAKIKAEGYPLTLDDLEKLYPPIPDEENRAVIYRKILPSLHPLPPKFDFIPILGKSSKKQMPFPKRGEPVPPELQSLIAEFSADFQPQYELIKLAHTRPHTRFDLKISDGSTMNFKEVLEVRRLVNFLKIKTLHACQNKNPEEAADLLIDQFLLTESIEQAPGILGLWVKYAMQSVAIGSLEDTLNRMPLTNPQLKSLASTLEKINHRSDCHIAFCSKRVFWINEIDKIKTPAELEDISSWSTSSPFLSLPGLPTSMPDSLDPVEWKNYVLGSLRYVLYSLYFTLGFKEADLLTSLKIDGQIVAQSKNVNSLKTLEKNVDLDSEKLPPYRVLSKLTVSGIAGTVSRSLILESQKNIALCALAIEQFRNDHNRLPSSLDELVPAYLPAVPTDLFDDKPLRYSLTPKGYIVYSVGKDETDNKGTIKKPSGGSMYSPGTDIVFTVERP